MNKHHNKSLFSLTLFAIKSLLFPVLSLKRFFKSKFQLLCFLSLFIAFSVAADCDHQDVYIVNLSQDALDMNNSDICTSLDSDFLIRECIAEQIREGLPDDCETLFDIFVPGTNAEHGAWKQFNHMFQSDTNRAHLVLAYDDARTVEGLANFDGAFYDNGVIEARTSLILLLDALDDYFVVEKIRVFGHSKGSHAVTLVAEEAPYSDVEFYAFAQPGRTAVDIDSSPEIVPGELGTPGYIEKLLNNLVGITWQNDEVQYYTGNGTNGLSLPEIWSFPGYIWQENNGGGASLTNYLHIDHHNNYGGFYTDGISGNDWREGEGTESDSFPYCATGDQLAAEDSSECQKQDSRKVPYFWGSPECVAQAFRMMQAGDVGDTYNIGFSGPRKPGTCEPSQNITRVTWNMRYRYDLPDRDCKYHLEFGFRDLITNRLVNGFEVVGDTDNDQRWLESSGTVFVPIHMRLTLRAWLEQVSQGGITPNCNSPTESEAWISHLKLTFDHPGTAEANKVRTIIGLDEGRGSFNNIHRWDNVAWEQPNINNEEIRMYYSAPRNSIKIETLLDTDANDEGNFRKVVHLID